MAAQNSQSQFRTTVTIGGINLGPALKWTGGEKTSTVGTAFDDKGGHPTSGPPTRSNGTATYNYTPAIHLVKRKIGNTGNAACTVARVPLADDGSEYPGGAYSMAGKLVTLGEPDSDQSSSDPTTIDIEMALEVDLL